MSSPDTNDPFARGARPRRTWPWIALGIAVLAGGAIAWWAFEREKRREAAESEARQVLEPLAKKLAEAPQAETGPYDVDKTMRVLAELDRAARESCSTREYVDRLVRQDYRGVPADVLAARRRVLDVLVRMAGVRGRVEEHDQNWGAYREVLEAVELANSTTVRVSFGPLSFGNKADEEVRSKARAELEQSLAQREQLTRAYEPLEAELLQVIDDGAPAMRRCAQDWEHLCLQRDAAYLAAVRMDWETCAVRAREAIARSPSETEAHLLLVLAHVEGGVPSSPEQGDVATTIAGFIGEHPDHAAPALLLRGAWHAKNGRAKEAREDFDLASTRYPLQASRLKDELDPYALREYLRNTTQGRSVTGLYQALMLGAGWFSPELQLARLAFDAGDRTGGRKLVLEHFQRRRKDQQWNLVLYDVSFCEGLLGDDFAALFPEGSYLDLVIETTTISALVSSAAKWIGKESERVLEARVENRSDRTLSNSALVLCLRVTDMHPDDYFTRALPTQPTLPPWTETVFGAVEIDPVWRARGKGVDDLVEPIRAILLTDEAVFRIDSIRYRNESIERYLSELTGERISLPKRLDEAVARIEAGSASIRWSSTATEHKLELPREFALLGPLFTLELGERRQDEVLDAGDVEHRIEAGRVVLTFDRSLWSVGEKAPETALLRARNRVQPLTIVFRREGEGYVVDRIERR